MSVSVDRGVVEDRRLAAPETDRPAGLRSPTVLSLNAAGWLILACLFLPVCSSCNGVTVRPVELLSITFPVQAANIFWGIITLGVYGNGALIALLITWSAGLRSPTLWWRGFTAQFAFTLIIGLAIGSVPFWSLSTLEQFLKSALALWMPLVGSLMWIIAPLRRDEPAHAWARLQHVWNIGTWLELHLLCLFRTELFVGYWVTWLAIVAQFFAVELARHRLHHDLWDSAYPVAQPQFSLRAIFLWTTLPPLIFAYYQTIGPAIDWLL